MQDEESNVWSIQSAWEELYLYSCYIPTTQCPRSSFLWADSAQPFPLRPIWPRILGANPTPAGRTVKNNIDTNKGGLWNSRGKQKHNLWRTDHTWAHGLPSSSFCSSSGSPAGPDIALGLRHTGDPGSKCFFRCITQPLESSDFRATAHRLLLLKGASLLRSDKSSINLRHSPLSPRQRQWNIATHWVLVTFVWPRAEWHGKTKKSYEQTTLT